ILIHSPKTARYEGNETREIPLFPELVPYIDAWWEACPEGREHVIGPNRGTQAAWRTRLLKLLRRLGIPAWPRIYHNLRASRQTELEAQWPTYIVCRWLGNSPEVSRENYLMVTDDHFREAAAGGASSGQAALKAALQPAVCQPNATNTGFSNAKTPE